MVAVSSIELFNALKDKVGEKEAKMLTEFMEFRAADTFDKAKSQLAGKEDLSKLELVTRDSIAKLALSTNESIAKHALSTNESITRLELANKESFSNLAVTISRLETKITDSKIDMIKWGAALLSPFYVSLILFLLKYFFR